jgi:DNA (cytosine-5)-methyltransferase 1
LEEYSGLIGPKQAKNACIGPRLCVFVREEEEISQFVTDGPYPKFPHSFPRIKAGLNQGGLMNKATGPLPINAIDLFSGCGGLSFGFEAAGIQTGLAVDNWPDALKTFSRNHPKSKTELFDLGAKTLKPLINSLNDSHIVFGGPPCQGFSISGKRDPNDPRNMLYRGFFQVVAEIRPRVFVMENVPNLASMDGGRLIQEIENDFKSLGYNLSRKILLASDFGVPQNRRRLILVGTLSERTFEFPQGTTLLQEEKVTCREALSDLPEQSLEDGSSYRNGPESDYQKLMREFSSGIFNHTITQHSEQTIRIVSLVPDGGNYKDLPLDLQSTRKVNIAWTRYSSKKPSLTIDTGHRHHFHYSYNRIPTVRESARLQSFPDSFIFEGSKTSQYKQVGNAVPPLMAQALGESIRNYLNDEVGKMKNAV